MHAGVHDRLFPCGLWVLWGRVELAVISEPLEPANLLIQDSIDLINLLGHWPFNWRCVRRFIEFVSMFFFCAVIPKKVNLASGNHAHRVFRKQNCASQIRNKLLTIPAPKP